MLLAALGCCSCCLVCHCPATRRQVPSTHSALCFSNSPQVWAVREAVCELAFGHEAGRLAATPFYITTYLLVAGAYLISVLVPSIYVSLNKWGGEALVPAWQGSASASHGKGEQRCRHGQGPACWPSRGRAASHLPSAGCTRS